MSEQSTGNHVRGHVFISGRVQGVSFRWYTHNKAQELGLTGWVRNLWDRRVEAIFEGPEEIVKQAVAWCQYGERPARVDDMKVTYSPATREFKYFRIKY